MDGNVNQRQFSELLRSHRLRRGSTQRQLADLSTVSVRAIRDLELGRTSRPRRDTVRLIADGLGLSGRARLDFGAAAAAGGVVSARDLKMIYDADPAPPPAPLDALVGREVEVAVVQELLASGSQRLVTVAGLSGVGKTRIALEVAGALHESNGFPVLWSSADGQRGPAAVKAPDPVADLVRSGLDDLLGSTDAAGELACLIGQRPTLLVLDGYQAERVRTDRLVTLLYECRGLRVLTTARAPFDVHGERTFPLAPLAVPRDSADGDVAALNQVQSVRLLVRYVRQVQPGFEVTEANALAVAELCRRLDGIPVALEAAASWFMIYAPGALLDCLRADPFTFATDKLSELSASLYRTVSALSPTELSALNRLGDAEPGWSMADAVGLTGLSPVVCARLVRRLLILGLVRPVDETDRARFQVLGLVRALGAGQHLGEPVRAEAV